MGDREELAALRRMAELEAKASGGSAAPSARAPEDYRYDIGIPVKRNTSAQEMLDSRLAPFSSFGKLFDVAAYEAGGAATDLAAKVLPPETAAKVGLAANVGLQAVPMFLGGNIGAKAAPVFEQGARSLMQSAVKPSLDALTSGRSARAIDTMLKEGVNVSMGGVGKLRAQINSLNDEIAAAIANSPATVDRNRVASELFNTVKKFEKQVTPGSDVKAIESAWQEFLTHPLLRGNNIPVPLAQELKQGTYRILDKKYGEMGSAATEAQKTLARGLKEGIAEAVPEVAQLNAKESALLNALQVMERRALMEGNKNPVGIGWLAKNPGAMAGFLADKSAIFKSIIARMVNAGATTIPQTGGQLVGGAIGATSGNSPAQ